MKNHACQHRRLLIYKYITTNKYWQYIARKQNEILFTTKLNFNTIFFTIFFALIFPFGSKAKCLSIKRQQKTKYRTWIRGFYGRGRAAIRNHGARNSVLHCFSVAYCGALRLVRSEARSRSVVSFQPPPEAELLRNWTAIQIAIQK